MDNEQLSFDADFRRYWRLFLRNALFFQNIGHDMGFGQIVPDYLSKTIVFYIFAEK